MSNGPEAWHGRARGGLLVQLTHLLVVLDAHTGRVLVVLSMVGAAEVAAVVGAAGHAHGALSIQRRIEQVRGCRPHAADLLGRDMKSAMAVLVVEQEELLRGSDGGGKSVIIGRSQRQPNGGSLILQQHM